MLKIKEFRVRSSIASWAGERPHVEIVIGLVIYAIIWTVVILGSEFMNKNVQ